MSPMAIALDEMTRAAGAGELVIVPHQRFPVAELITLAALPAGLTFVSSPPGLAGRPVYVGNHDPEPAQLRVAARRRWAVERCTGMAPHVHCPRCGCGQLEDHPLPARVERPCSCGCHPPRRVHGSGSSWAVA